VRKSGDFVLGGEASVELRDQIEFLDRVLKEHIRKWERFFSGAEKVPPQIERERIGRRIRPLSEQTINRRADQFRLEQLQHRFQTYSMNWERMLREREEGRARAGGQTRWAASEATGPRPNAGGPRAVQHQEGASLYDRYVAAKRAQGLDVTVDRTTFESQLKEQERALRSKTGGDVRFEVLVENGKVRLAARTKKVRSNRE